MFHTLLAHVTFDQVVQFCQTFPEGVRVEYKREPTNISKVISSFANTAGGIWVIGVETDNTTNRPKQPITGIPSTPGIEERIVQSAQTGIYPAITPDVRVVEVEGNSGNIVVVVKVPESIEAPHAIEGSTRVYVRVASTTSPFDLADIDRIEYMLKRRQEPERRREELIAQAAVRSPYQKSYLIRVVVAPIYPRGVLIAPDTLYERAEDLERRGLSYLGEFRRIHEGLMSSTRIQKHIAYHFEVNVHGIAFLDEPREPAGAIKILRTEESVPCIAPILLLYSPALLLNSVIRLFEGMVTNILIRYELFGWQGVSLLPEFKGRMLDPALAAERYRCVDSNISVSTYAILENLTDRRVDVLTEIMEQVLWAFNYTDSNLRTHVETLMKANNLI